MKVHLDPCDHRFQRDPYPCYKALRDHEPVYYNAERGFWLLTRWADVNADFRAQTSTTPSHRDGTIT